MKKRAFFSALRIAMAMSVVLIVALPAAAQFSDSYEFLKAVRDRDGTKVAELIDRPGVTMINTRDYDSGDTALHIVTKRRDAQWIAFLLAREAKPDARDREGNTPMILAARIGFTDGIQTLLAARAGVNIANNRGETPLIIAVQNRDIATVRVLLAAGATATTADRVTGMNARDYAARDNRATMILKLIDDYMKAAPPANISGPKL